MKIWSLSIRVYSRSFAANLLRYGWRPGVPLLYWATLAGTYGWASHRHRELPTYLALPWSSWLRSVIWPGPDSVLFNSLVACVIAVIVCGALNSAVLYGLLSVEWRRFWSRPQRRWRHRSCVLVLDGGSSQLFVVEGELASRN